jgi:hypothetical protein
VSLICVRHGDAVVVDGADVDDAAAEEIGVEMLLLMPMMISVMRSV